MSGRTGAVRIVACGRLALIVGLLLSAAACRGGRMESAGQVSLLNGDPERGRVLIDRFDCGACHTIPGVRGARGAVGPPLIFWSRRTYIAGQLPNTPPNLVRWVRNPQAVEPGTAMPALGLDERQARDVAAYLYTLR
jgi:cytochrome c2